MRTIGIIYSTSTGHTEHVVDVLIETLEQELKDSRITKQRAETAKPEDLTKPDILLLACGTWNTGTTEGQLNPFMYDFLLTRAKDTDLKGLPAAAIGLGDERYYFTARAAEKLTEFLTAHKATILLPALKIVNEPYGQEAKVETWSKEFAMLIEKLPVKTNVA